MNIGQKIKQARKRKKLSQAKLAELCGWDSQGRIGNYETGAREPSLEDLKKIAIALEEPMSYFVQETSTKMVIEGVPIIEWECPEDLPEGQYVFIPRFDVHISAGNGHVVYDTLEKEQPQAFRTDWVRRKRLTCSGLMCVYAKGNSMEDRIHDGDSLLIDRNQRDVIDGKIYAIRYGNDVRVKRLFKRPDGGLIIVSDNKDEFPPVSVPLDEMEHIEIIGRVVHISSEA